MYQIDFIIQKHVSCSISGLVRTIEEHYIFHRTKRMSDKCNRLYTQNARNICGRYFLLL